MPQSPLHLKHVDTVRERGTPDDHVLRKLLLQAELLPTLHRQSRLENGSCLRTSPI